MRSTEKHTPIDISQRLPYEQINQNEVYAERQTISQVTLRREEDLQTNRSTISRLPPYRERESTKLSILMDTIPVKEP
jgi:hypothetical protein